MSFQKQQFPQTPLSDILRLTKQYVYWRPLALLRRYTHKGETYTCNLCGHSFAKFLPYGLDVPVLTELDVVGGQRRENVQCPNCYAGERERLLAHYLKNQIPGSASIQTILHGAPEKQLTLKLEQLFPAAKIFRFDLFPKEYQNIPRPVILQDLTALDFKDGAADLFICNHVLEHIPGDAQAMREIFRCLKPGGIALLQVPYSEKIRETLEDEKATTPEQRLTRFGQGDHVRLYALEDYINRLKAIGFKDITQSPPETAPNHGFHPRERVLAFQKPIAATTRAAP